MAGEYYAGYANPWDWAWAMLQRAGYTSDQAGEILRQLEATGGLPTPEWIRAIPIDPGYSWDQFMGQAPAAPFGAAPPPAGGAIIPGQEQYGLVQTPVMDALYPYTTGAALTREGYAAQLEAARIAAGTSAANAALAAGASKEVAQIAAQSAMDRLLQEQKMQLADWGGTGRLRDTLKLRQWYAKQAAQPGTYSAITDPSTGPPILGLPGFGGAPAAGGAGVGGMPGAGGVEPFGAAPANATGTPLPSWVGNTERTGDVLGSMMSWWNTAPVQPVATRQPGQYYYNGPAGVLEDAQGNVITTMPPIGNRPPAGAAFGTQGAGSGMLVGERGPEVLHMKPFGEIEVIPLMGGAQYGGTLAPTAGRPNQFDYVPTNMAAFQGAMSGVARSAARPPIIGSPPLLPGAGVVTTQPVGAITPTPTAAGGYAPVLDPLNNLPALTGARGTTGITAPFGQIAPMDASDFGITGPVPFPYQAAAKFMQMSPVEQLDLLDLWQSQGISPEYATFQLQRAIPGFYSTQRRSYSL